jgi:predicted nucleic acid-binding protein
MDKLRAFLDTNVIIRLLLEPERELSRLFTEEMLRKVAYVTSPIVLQELLLATERFSEKIDLGEFDRYIELVAIGPPGIQLRLDKNLRELRNLAVHSNDALLILAAQDTNCDYFLTYDLALIRAIVVSNLELRAMPPEQFIEILEAEQ